MWSGDGHIIAPQHASFCIYTTSRAPPFGSSLSRAEGLAGAPTSGALCDDKEVTHTCRTAALITMAAVECEFSSLPLCCALKIFARLTCWERLRSRAVSRAWRATLSDGLLWRDVDLSYGERGERVSASFLTAVGRVADGYITSLDFSGQMSHHELLLPALQAFLAAHAATLRHLVLRHNAMTLEEARAFFQHVPIERIEVWFEFVICYHDECQPLLCCEAPFETLRLQSLCSNVAIISLLVLYLTTSFRLRAPCRWPATCPAVPVWRS